MPPDYSDLNTLTGAEAAQIRQTITNIDANLASGDAEAAGDAARLAFELSREHPAVASLAEKAQAVLQQASGLHVTGFELVGGGTYPRTAEQILTEQQVRHAIATALSQGVHPSKINHRSIERAFPTRLQAIRSQVDQIVGLANSILALNLLDLAQNNQPLPPGTDAILDALAQPPMTGTYKDLRNTLIRLNAAARRRGERRPYIGYQVDHFLRDQMLRCHTGRTHALHDVGFATVLHDGTIQGTQHKYVTDAQDAYIKRCRSMGLTPTIREAVEAALGWMEMIYLKQGLAIDYIMEPNSLKLAEISRTKEEGYGLHHGGLMTRREREKIAKAAAAVVGYRAIRSWAENGHPPDERLAHFLNRTVP